MRRERMTSREDAETFLKQAGHGILSLASPDGEPYGVPLNYVYVPSENALFFHCAIEGRKLDLIRENPRASFAVVANGEIVSERFTTRYESAIAAGRVLLVEERDEKIRALRWLCDALTPGQPRAESVIIAQLPAVAILRFDIESLTGKRNSGA